MSVSSEEQYFLNNINNYLLNDTEVVVLNTKSDNIANILTNNQTNIYPRDRNLIYIITNAVKMLDKINFDIKIGDTPVNYTNNLKSNLDDAKKLIKSIINDNTMVIQYPLLNGIGDNKYFTANVTANNTFINNIEESTKDLLIPNGKNLIIAVDKNSVVNGSSLIININRSSYCDNNCKQSCTYSSSNTQIVDTNTYYTIEDFLAFSSIIIGFLIILCCLMMLSI